MPSTRSVHPLALSSSVFHEGRTNILLLSPLSLQIFADHNIEKQFSDSKKDTAYVSRSDQVSLGRLLSD